MGPAGPDLVAAAPLTIELAGLRIALTGLWPSLAAAARERYRAFAGDGGDPTLTIAVSPTPQSAHAPEGDPFVDRLGDARFTVHYGTLVADLALDAGVGRAEVADSVHVVDSLLRIATSLLLLRRGGLLLHASSVELDGGGALVCFGPSGVGKTTVARSVPAAAVLCDELTALYPDKERVMAAGTPFHGDLPVCSPRALPLAALCRLRQADRDRLTALSPATAVRELLASTLFFCREQALVIELVDVTAALAGNRVHMLEFQRDCHVLRLVQRHLAHDALPADAQAPRPQGRR